MAKTEHTRGPWEYDNSGKYFHPGTIRVNGMVIARVFHNTPITEKEAEANGKLIAAAPQYFAFVRDIADNEARCTCDEVSWYGEDHAASCLYAQAHELIYGYRPESKP